MRLNEDILHNIFLQVATEGRTEVTRLTQWQQKKVIKYLCRCGIVVEHKWGTLGEEYLQEV